MNHPQNEYDCVVIGEHPAGLWAAKHLLGQGLTVLVIPIGTHDFGGILPKSVAQSFDLKDETSLQVITPTRRIQIFSDEVKLKEEYQFNFGQELSRRSSSQEDFARGMAYWVRGSDSVPYQSSEWPWILEKFQSSSFFGQSSRALVAHLLTKLSDAGAFVTQAAQLRQIFLDRKTLVGVQLSETSQMISTKNVFINTNFDSVNRFLNDPLPLRSRPSGWNFEIAFECSSDFLPLGLTKRMAYVQKDSPLLEIFEKAPGKFHLKTGVPFQDYTLDRGNQRRLASRMLKVCEDLFPDLQYNLKRVIPDLRDPDRAVQVELPALYPFETLEQIPSSLFVYGRDSGLGYQTPIPGLYLTNEEAFPQNGVWGAFEAAQKSLESWAKRDQKPGLGLAL